MSDDKSIQLDHVRIPSINSTCSDSNGFQNPSIPQLTQGVWTIEQIWLLLRIWFDRSNKVGLSGRKNSHELPQLLLGQISARASVHTRNCVPRVDFLAVEPAGFASCPRTGATFAFGSSCCCGKRPRMKGWSLFCMTWIRSAWMVSLFYAASEWRC